MKIAYAHCDVPCGLYDTNAASLAAQTCLKMTEKILELPADGSAEEVLAARNSFVRMVATKEEHAQKCKDELLILWTDYFKPEHLASFPDLHETFWKAAKLATKVKQNIDLDAAKELVAAVIGISEIFDKSKS